MVANREWEKSGPENGQQTRIEDFPPYRPHSDTEILEIARAICAGEIYGLWNLPEESMRNLVFPLLNFMGPVHLEVLKRDDIFTVYQYMEKASGIINRLPVFFSFRVLNTNDFDRIMDTVKSIIGGAIDGTEKGPGGG